jgi:hypothetical protein
MLLTKQKQNSSSNKFELIIPVDLVVRDQSHSYQVWVQDLYTIQEFLNDFHFVGQEEAE